MIVFANAGSVHHVGPNRFYVELARTLAEAGFRTLRLDLRNLGDSVEGPCPDENHPYPSSAVSDVAHTMDWATDRFGDATFVVAGLCSGAHTAFHSGLGITAHEIAAVVAINPLAFYWHPDMSLETPDTSRTIADAKYYGRAIRDPRNWGRLLRGRSNILYIAGFVGRRILQLLVRIGRRTLEAVGLFHSTDLARDLRRLRDRRCLVHFVFSSDDPGYEILKDGASRELDRLSNLGAVEVTLIPDADHTFSRKSERATAIRQIRDWATVTLG